MKTSELTGAALDYVLATIAGLPMRLDPMGFGKQSPGGYWVWPDNFPPNPDYAQIGKDYSPSTKWDQGGPIIEREGVELVMFGAGWTAMIRDADAEPWQENGPTPLIAAMRCYVASKLGDEVTLPAELQP